MTNNWVTAGTWVSFDQTAGPGEHNLFPLLGYVYDITPCGLAAVLVPFDGFDEVHLVPPEAVRETFRLDEVKLGLEILTSAEIDSITFDAAERQLRIDAARQTQQEADDVRA